MADIIIAFPKIEDAKNLRRILNKNGHDVTLVCDSGAQIVSAANSLDGGIVICGYRFSDMHYSEMYEYLPTGFQMLLLASPVKLADCDVRGLMALPMPFKVQDLMSTLEIMLSQYYRWRKKQKKKPKARSEQDQKKIVTAKELLMDRNHITEEEAHHYIQKISMDSGTNMVETAEMILELNGKEWDL